MAWEEFRGGSVTGDVRVLRGELDRDLYVYLPPSHGRGRRFPAVYMHDGQNLFDAATSNSGEWRVDETMEELAREGLEAIVVGIPSRDGAARGREYAGDGTRDYLELVVGTVRPLVGRDFDVDTSRDATGIAGSSLGGVSSLLALYEHRDVFGFVGILSPAFWWNGDDRWYDLVTSSPPPDARVYMDVGDAEDPEEGRRRAYIDGFERMSALLAPRFVRLRTVLDRGGIHHESAWARRLPDAFRFLLRR